jgi:cytochrome c1
MGTIAPVYTNPDMELTDANIKDLVAYLNSLK